MECLSCPGGLSHNVTSCGIQVTERNAPEGRGAWEESRATSTLAAIAARVP